MSSGFTVTPTVAVLSKQKLDVSECHLKLIRISRWLQANIWWIASWCYRWHRGQGRTRWSAFFASLLFQRILWSCWGEMQWHLNTSTFRWKPWWLHKHMAAVNVLVSWMSGSLAPPVLSDSFRAVMMWCWRDLGQSWNMTQPFIWLHSRCIF